MNEKRDNLTKASGKNCPQENQGKKQSIVVICLSQKKGEHLPNSTLREGAKTSWSESVRGGQIIVFPFSQKRAENQRAT